MKTKELNKISVTINFTESDIQDLLSDVADGEFHEVFNWTFTSDQGHPIEVNIVVNDDEE